MFLPSGASGSCYLPAHRPYSHVDLISCLFGGDDDQLSFSPSQSQRKERGMLPSAAESGIELSCRDTIRTNTMTETVPIDRPPTARATVSRRRSAKPATVSASALAQHLDCSRTYVGKLEAEGVIQRQGDGFPLDQSRVAYLRYLRRERQQSPRTEADAAHVTVKTECCNCG